MILCNELVMGWQIFRKSNEVWGLRDLITARLWRLNRHGEAERERFGDRKQQGGRSAFPTEIQAHPNGKSEDIRDVRATGDPDVRQREGGRGYKPFKATEMLPLLAASSGPAPSLPFFAIQTDASHPRIGGGGSRLCAKWLQVAACQHLEIPARDQPRCARCCTYIKREESLGPNGFLDHGVSCITLPCHFCLSSRASPLQLPGSMAPCWSWRPCPRITQMLSHGRTRKYL